MNIKTYFKVYDIVNKNVHSCAMDDSLDNVAKVMKEKNISSILVQNGKNYEGLITEKSLVNEVLFKNKLLSECKVKDVMIADIPTILPDESIITAAILMIKKNINILTVVNEGVLIGIISMSDVMNILPEFLELLYENARIEYSQTKQFETEQYRCDLCWNYDDSVEYIDGTYICDSCGKETMIKKAD